MDPNVANLSLAAIQQIMEAIAAQVQHNVNVQLGALTVSNGQLDARVQDIEADITALKDQQAVDAAEFSEQMDTIVSMNDDLEGLQEAAASGQGDQNPKVLFNKLYEIVRNQQQTLVKLEAVVGKQQKLIDQLLGQLENPAKKTKTEDTEGGDVKKNDEGSVPITI